MCTGPFCYENLNFSMYTCKQKILTVKNKLFTSKNITILLPTLTTMLNISRVCHVRMGQMALAIHFFFGGGGAETKCAPPFST